LGKWYAVKITEEEEKQIRAILEDCYQMLWENKPNIAIIQRIVQIVSFHLKKVDNTVIPYFVQGVAEVLKGEQGKI
jgi:thymidylate synthase ThyX